MTADGILSQQDADTLHDARLVLEQLAQAAGPAAWQTNASQASDYGRFAQACGTAEDAIFDVLNVAMSYLRDPIAQASHEQWLSRNKEPAEA